MTNYEKPEMEVINFTKDEVFYVVTASLSHYNANTGNIELGLDS